MYATSFDYRKFWIGMKYSDRWRGEFTAVTLVGERDVRYTSVYAPFDQSAEAIAEDWFNCGRDVILPATVPPNCDWGKIGWPLPASITIDAREIFFVVVSAPQLNGVMRRQQGAYFFEASKDGRWLVTWDKDKWERIPLVNVESPASETKEPRK
jgi:hypothetical protein